MRNFKISHICLFLILSLIILSCTSCSKKEGESPTMEKNEFMNSEKEIAMGEQMKSEGFKSNESKPEEYKPDEDKFENDDGKLSVETNKQDIEIIKIESFEDETLPAYISANGSNIELVPYGATDGKQALKIEFNSTAAYPGVNFRPQKPWNWGNDKAFVIDITNPTEKEISFNIRIDDDPSADGFNHCITGNDTIMPNETKTYIVNLSSSTSSFDPMDYGMKGLPPVLKDAINVKNYWGEKSLDLSHIVGFIIFLNQTDASKTLIVDNIRIIPANINALLSGIVDEFGQYTKQDWSGKIKSIEELKETWEKEEQELKEFKKPQDRGMYGGWLEGPKLDATGYFRTEKVDGKWWLVDPEGYLFFSTGLDCIRLHDMNTIIEGREYMFKWLPNDDDPLVKHYGYASNVHAGPVSQGRTFNFYTANLERRYGSDYLEQWRETAVKRLSSWGFNTIGNWPDDGFLGNGSKYKMPYVAHGWIEKNHAQLKSGADYWGNMHDPFDPRFAMNVEIMAKSLAKKIQDDPWCIGVFVDNELSWGNMNNDKLHYGLVLSALNSSASVSPAKRAFLKELENSYGTVDNFNKAWNTNFNSWEELNNPFNPAEPFSDEVKQDLSKLLKMLAEKYFSQVRTEIKKVLPNHLYLGCRLALWGSSPEVIEAAAKYCDVVSFNSYTIDISGEQWSFLEEIDKPHIIGEFSFGAPDRGNFYPCLPNTVVEDQNQRAEYFKRYVMSVVENPYFVGCHWFQYVDQPITGRAWDGENYNVGFVAITDIPHKEMVEAAREIHIYNKIYEMRYSK